MLRRRGNGPKPQLPKTATRDHTGVRESRHSADLDPKRLNWPPFPSLVTCSYGETTKPTKRIALVGNSHGAHWQPALEQVAKQNGRLAQTYVMAFCQPINWEPDEVGSVGGISSETMRVQCLNLAEDVIDTISAEHFDLVVMSTLDRGQVPQVAEYQKSMSSWLDSGAKILVVRDTPSPGDPANPIPNCVAAHEADPSACAGTPATWIGYDSLADAATQLQRPDVAVVDLNEYLCKPDVCPAVIGGVIVYSDFNHMTATFNRSLAPYLQTAIEKVLGLENG